MVDEGLHDELILIRTAEGQDAAFDELQLEERSRRLLRLVNGYTPLGTFVARLDTRHDWRATARDLLQQGLIAVEER